LSQRPKGRQPLELAIAAESPYTIGDVEISLRAHTGRHGGTQDYLQHCGKDQKRWKGD